MKFSEKIIRWYQKNKRDLPWRKTTDPYKIWLSEIILQQTRIEQGLKYYLRFIDNYPDINSLAMADEKRVLKLWQGLGYYSRARNMHKTASIIVDKYQGRFPDNYSDIINLKGIGDYTAAAIVSFAYNQDNVSDIPVKIKNTKLRKRYFYYFLLIYNGHIYLNKRISNDIWKNLYDFPHVETNRFFPESHVTEEFTNQFKIPQDRIQILNTSDEYKHILTHQQILARFYVIKFQNQKLFRKVKTLNSNQFICIKKETIDLYPLPRLIDKYLIENQINQ
jgi:adenine-specific DNA glycosylase